MTIFSKLSNGITYLLGIDEVILNCLPKSLFAIDECFLLFEIIILFCSSDLQFAFKNFAKHLGLSIVLRCIGMGLFYVTQQLNAPGGFLLCMCCAYFALLLLQAPTTFMECPHWPEHAVSDAKERSCIGAMAQMGLFCARVSTLALYYAYQIFKK